MKEPDLTLKDIAILAIIFSLVFIVVSFLWALGTITANWFINLLK